MPGVLKKRSRVNSNSDVHILSPSTDGSQSQIQDSSMINSGGAEMLSPNVSSLPSVSTGMKKKRVKVSIGTVLVLLFIVLHFRLYSEIKC